MTDRRYHAPATQRNRDPILAVLQTVLPPTGTVLEVASGSGEHGLYFAPRLAPRQWVPSDPDPDARASIAAWQQHAPAPNWHPPLALDATAPPWDLAPIAPLLERAPLQAVVCINMVHISPWAACVGLLAAAGHWLPPGGVLYLYGPYWQVGQAPAPSNLAFHQSLQARNPAWGIRDLEAVVTAAEAVGFALDHTQAMPANNLSVVLRQG